MHAYVVGQPYHRTRRSWPECAQYNYRGGEHELVLFWGSPTPGEVAGVRRGTAELGLYVEGPLVVLLYRFRGACNWSDAPYSWHLVPQAEQALPGVDGPDTRALLHVLLVDAHTGLVRALRALTLSPELTAYTHTAIRAQAAQPWHPAAYDAALRGLYARHPSCDDLARAAALVEVAGRL